MPWVCGTHGHHRTQMHLTLVPWPTAGGGWLLHPCGDCTSTRDCQRGASGQEAAEGLPASGDALQQPRAHLWLAHHQCRPTVGTLPYFSGLKEARKQLGSAAIAEPSCYGADSGVLG